MIRAQSITVLRAGSAIIDDFSLEIERGTVLAIIGANGSGKSTLLGALCGDLPLATGEVSVDGTLLSALSVRDLAALRSVAPQHQRFTLAYTVRELFSMATRYSGDLSSVARAVAALEIGHLLSRKVTSLSGGEQQRVSIAMALAQQTPYVFLDEPFSAQDLASADRIAAHAQALARTGKAVVIVAHKSAAELSWCDRVITLGSNG